MQPQDTTLEFMTNPIQREKKKVIVITDGTYDNQEGVRQAYYSKQDWIAKTIERMAEDGYRLQQRLPNECMIFELL